MMKTLLKWLGRIAVVVLALVAILACVGLLYQGISAANDAGRFPPPGELVDVGGRRMHLHCMGSGSPTVILEAGQANSSSVWSWIGPEVAKTTRVCAYDRAGIAWSDDSSNPRDAAHMAEELHALLDAAGVARPVVLVGHSFGGLVTHVYAAQYPGEVAGMVWLDRMHPDQWTRLPEERELRDGILQMSNLGRLIAPFGLVRLSNYFPRVQELPAQQADEFKAWTDSTRFMNANAAEFSSQDQSLPQARAAGPLGALPLVVVTATDHGYPEQSSAKLEQAWSAMQTELAALSSNSVHRIIPDSTHGSLQVDQQDAQSAVEAIKLVVDAARTGQSLSE